jgi:hypothetical protein
LLVVNFTVNKVLNHLLLTQMDIKCADQLESSFFTSFLGFSRGRLFLMGVAPRFGLYSVIINVIPRTVIARFFGELRSTVSLEKGTTRFSLSFFSLGCFLMTREGVGDPESLLSGEKRDLAVPRSFL